MAGRPLRDIRQRAGSFTNPFAPVPGAPYFRASEFRRRKGAGIPESELVEVLQPRHASVYRTIEYTPMYNKRVLRPLEKQELSLLERLERALESYSAPAQPQAGQPPADLKAVLRDAEGALLELYGSNPYGFRHGEYAKSGVTARILNTTTLRVKARGYVFAISQVPESGALTCLFVGKEKK